MSATPPGRIRGLWWLPSQSDVRLSGDLVLEPGEVAELELIGSFSELPRIFSERSWSAEVVHGLSVAGEQYTLLDCVEHHTTFGSGVTVQHLSCFGAVLVGAHVDAETRFERITVELDGLADVVGQSGIDVNFDPADSSRFSVHYDRPSVVEAVLPGRRVRLAATWSMKGGRTANRLELTELWLLETIYDTSQPLEDVIGSSVVRMRDLVTFARDRPSAVLGVQVALDRPEPGRLAWLRVHLPWLQPAGSDDGRRRSHEELFTLPGDPTEFDEFVTSWVALCDSCGEVLDLHFAAGYGGEAFAETRFTMAVQAAEAYHRRAFPVEIDPNDAVRRDRVIAAAPPDDREWLSDRLRYAHEPSLRRRIKDLVRLSGDVGAAYAPNSGARTALAARIVEARNSLTHWNADDADRPDGERLVVLTAVLRSILKSAFLQQLGMSVEAAADRVARTNDHRYAARELWASPGDVQHPDPPEPADHRSDSSP